MKVIVSVVVGHYANLKLLLKKILAVILAQIITIQYSIKHPL